jgi:hypothetical protein
MGSKWHVMGDVIGVLAEFSARSSLQIDSARMNQERTFFVSGFFLELPFGVNDVSGHI